MKNISTGTGIALAHTGLVAAFLVTAGVVALGKREKPTSKGGV